MLAFDGVVLLAKGLAGVIAGLLLAFLLGLALDGSWIVFGASVLAVGVTLAVLKFSDVLFDRVVDRATGRAARSGGHPHDASAEKRGRWAFAVGTVIGLCITLFIPAGDVLRLMAG